MFACVCRWRSWAVNSRARAHLERSHDHAFDAELLEARAAVRDEAAEMLLSQDPVEAAALMMRRAVAHVVRNPPLMGYDQAAVEYTRARSWQFCAREIDPSLPEVQPRWA